MWRLKSMILWPTPLWEGEGNGGGGNPAPNSAPNPAPAPAPAPNPAPSGDPPAGTPKPGEGDPKPGEVFPSLKKPEGEGDPKPGEGDPPKNEYFGAPEGGKYEAFTFPEGFTADEALIGKFAPIAAKLGLSQAGAQELANFYATEIVGPQSAAFVEQVSNWFKETENDAEIGGQKFEESLAAATRGLDAFGTKGLKQLLVQYGLGNHPEVVRVFTRIGKAIVGEDTSGGKGQVPGGETDFLTKMYGPPKSQ